MKNQEKKERVEDEERSKAINRGNRTRKEVTGKRRRRRK